MIKGTCGLGARGGVVSGLPDALTGGGWHSRDREGLRAGQS